MRFSKTGNIDADVSAGQPRSIHQQILMISGVNSVIDQRQNEIVVVRHHLKAAKSAIVRCDNTQKREAYVRLSHTRDISS